MTKALNKKHSRYEMDMCNGNLFFKIIIFSLPIMAMGFLQLFYNAADLLVVTNFSTNKDALGAVGSTSSLINLTVNLFMGLSVGANVVCAKLFGAGEKDKISKVVHTSILTSFIIGVFLMIFGFFFSKNLLALMNNDSEYSVLYLKIYFLGMPFNLVYNFAASILRAVGDTKRPLYYLSIAGAVNVVLNLFFVVVFKMDVDGVATATVISQIISCFLIIRTLCKTTECYKLEFKKLKIHGRSLWEIIKVGLPAGIQSSIFSISNVLIQSSINNFGMTVMNGNSAATSIEGFVYTAMNAIYHASLTFTSQNVGARKAINIKKVTGYSLIIVSAIAITLGGILFLLGPKLLTIYTTIPEEIEVGFIRLHYLCLPYFLCGIMDVMVGVLRGLGRSTLPMVVSILGVCGIRVAWILFVFTPNTNFQNAADLNLLYVSYPISWTITFFIHLICYFIFSRITFKKFTNQEMCLK